MAITYGEWSNEIKIIFPTRSSSSSSRRSSSSSSIVQTCQSTSLKVTTNNTEFTGQISTPAAQATSNLLKIDLSNINSGNNPVSYYEISINGTIHRTENSHFEFLGTLGQIYLIQARAVCDTTIVGGCRSLSMTISTNNTLFQGNIDQPPAQATSNLIKIDLSQLNTTGEFAFYEIFRDGVIYTTTDDHYEFSGTTGQTYLIKARAVCNAPSSSSLINSSSSLRSSSSSRISNSSMSSSSLSISSVSSSSSESYALQGDLSVSIVRTDSDAREVYFNVIANGQLIDSDTRQTDLNHLTTWGTQRNFLQYRFVNADAALPYGSSKTDWKSLFIFDSNNNKYTVVTQSTQIEKSYFDTLKNQIESNNINGGFPNVWMEFRIIKTLDPESIQPGDLFSKTFKLNYLYNSFYLSDGTNCDAGACINPKDFSEREVPPCSGVTSVVTAFNVTPLAHITDLALPTLDTGDTSGRKIDINVGCDPCI